MNKPSILHVIPSLGLGGAETFMYRLIKEDKKNHHYILCLKEKGHYGKKLEEDGHKVFALDLGNSINLIQKGKQLKLIFQSSQPNILNCWMYHGALFGTLVSLFFDVRNMIWLIRHAELDVRSTKISTIIVAKLCAFLSKRYPNFIIYNSTESRKVHEELGYAHQKSDVINNGFVLDDFYPDKIDRLSLREKLNISQNDLVFLHIARWHKDKDHETCLKALALFKLNYKENWKIIFVGTDMDKTNIELLEIIKKNNLIDHCIFLGERTDTKALYNGVDLTLLSSSTESFPNVIGESMACSTPCISSDVGSVRSLIVDDKWLFPVRDYKRMAIVLNKASLLKSNEKDWIKLRSDCRKVIERDFSFKKILSSYQSKWEASQ